MGILLDFLTAQQVGNETLDVVISDRFPAPFTIKVIGQDAFNEIQKRCKIRDKKKTVVDFDNLRFSVLVIAEGCIEPNFRNAEALSKAGCPDAETFIKKCMKPGEIAQLYTEISKLSGFDDDAGELIEEAKN